MGRNDRDIVPVFLFCEEFIVLPGGDGENTVSRDALSDTVEMALSFKSL